MKKTIAILLVLVIGMVGVWAATADLNLITIVYEFNEMIITENSTVPTWTTFPNTTNLGLASTYTDTSNANRKAVDPYNSTYQNVGYIHTRTNMRRGYSVSISATQLISSETGTAEGASAIVEKINYSIYNDLSGSTPTAVYTTADTAPNPETYVTQAAGTGMRVKSTPVYIKLATVGNSLSAGTYTGDITFTYTAI